MAGRQVRSNGLKLPPRLQQELGIDLGSATRKDGRRKTGGSIGRKQQRHAERVEKSAVRASKYQRRVPQVSDDGSERDIVKAPHMRERRTKIPTKTINSPPAAHANPKFMLKKPVAHAPPSTTSSEDSEAESRSSSPGLVLDSSSRAFKDRAAQDEAEILALEKKLGVKSKRLPKSFDEDGLGDLLDGFDSEEEKKKRKRKANNWLKQKRRKATRQETLEGSGSEDGASLEDAGEEDFSGEERLSEDQTTDAEDFASFSSDAEGDKSMPTKKRKRENPYIAPTTSETPTTKYIPPTLRKAPDSDTEALQRLRRQIQGHLNKLSEANLVSILNEIEQLYQSNARQDITSTLIELLLALFCDRSSLQTTFVILHASFIAAVYKVIGVDFGAEIVSRLVERLESYNAAKIPTPGKESNNLVSLLSYLFTFHVINSTLVFDFVRQFLEELDETNTELLLRVVRDCGPQLRQDDPSSLKSMVQIMQNVTANMAAEGKVMSVRTKFMIETITDLKNNKMRAALNSAGVASEHITQMRKVLGSLNNRNVKASEPLRISREDIRNSDKKGKWWLVGASWKGNTKDDAENNANDEIHGEQPDPNVETEGSDLLALARQYRMNTADAYLRLLKLRLKRSQEQEIPKVLLRCAGAESVYNPYYTLVAKKLSSEKKIKMAFQFSLWDFFKRMGEMGDEDESDDGDADSIELSEIVNLAKLYGNLIADDSISIGVLKVLNLAMLTDQAKILVEVLLVVILTASKGPQVEKTLTKVFSRAAEAPQMVKPLQYFIKKSVRSSDLVAKKEREAFKQGCKIATDILSMIEVS